MSERGTSTSVVQPFDGIPHEQWDDAMAAVGVDDAYLRLGWHRASAHLEPGGARPVLLRFAQPAGAVLLPLLLRRLPDDSGWDATSAYGYGGPAAAGDLDVAAFGDALDAWARDHGVVATFLRFHPLLGNARLAPPRAELIELGGTVAWDITAGRDLLPAMHTHHRRAARKADRAGLELRITHAPRELGEFRALYDETMRRQDAAAFYFFADPYWEALIDDSGGELVLVDGLLEGEVVASLLCIASGDSLHYHLGASAEAARTIGASNRCFLAAAQWAQDAGLRRFHLGGGVGGGSDSPLFTFKHRYDPSSEPHPFHVAKLVHDAGRYREVAGTDSTDGYFPPWRSAS